MSFRARYGGILPIVTLILVCARVQAYPFLNGGFEIVTDAPIASGAAMPLETGDTWLLGWILTSPPSVFVVNGSGAGFTPNLEPYEGNQWVLFGASNSPSGGRISQTFDTSVGQTCTVSFVVGQAGVGNTSLTAEAVSLNGLALASQNFTALAGTWTPCQMNFVAQTTNTILNFINTSAQITNVDIALDDVSVTGQPTNGPPELAVSPGSQTLNSGNPAFFTAVASGSPSSIQWLLGTNAVPGATNNTISFTANDATAGSYSVVFSNSLGSVTSVPAVLTVIDPPLIVASPLSQAVGVGTNVTLSATASGSLASVQWYLGSSAIAGATNTSLPFPASPATAGNYTVVFSNSAGAVTSAVAVVTVLGSPFINGGFETLTGTNIPAGSQLILNPGNTWLAGWTVGGPGNDIEVVNGSAEGLSPYEGVQWILFNSGNSPPGGILSQTFATAVGEPYAVIMEVGQVGSGPMSLTASALETNGAVLATNTCLPISGKWTQFQFGFTASTTNTTLLLTDTSTKTVGADLALDDVIVLRLFGPPSVNTSPSSQTANAGSLVTFTTLAEGGPSSVHWYLGSNAISGATNLTLSVTGSDATAGNYAVVFSNSFGTVTSAVAVLTVIDPPHITTSPVSQTAANGAAVSFTAAAAGSPFSLEWYFGPTPLPGATNTTLTLTASGLTAGNYTAVFSNAASYVTSGVAVLTVQGAPFTNGGFEITTSAPLASTSELSLNPGSTELAAWTVGGPGGDILLVNGPAEGLNPYEGEQWILFNAGDTPSGGTLSQTFATLAGQPYVVTFEVGEAGGGNNVSVTSAAIGGGGAVLATVVGVPVSGAWTQFQLFFNAQTTNTTLVFTDTSGYAPSTDVALDGVTLANSSFGAPAIATQPASQSAAAGAPVAFSVGTAGGPASFQWFFGADALVGATNATLDVTAGGATAGSYTAVVTNVFGAVTSRVAVLTVLGASFTNGGFEIVTRAPITPGSSVSLNPGDTWLTGWTVGGPGGDILVANGPAEGLDPYQGEQWIIFNSGDSPPGGTLAQTFATSIGEPYSVTLAVAGTGFYNTVSVGASALSSAGAVLATNQCVPALGSWSNFQLNFTAATTNTTLLLTDTSSGTTATDAALDDVAVLRLFGPPAVLIGPTSQIALAGRPVTFSALGDGAPSTIQWYLGANAVPGATNLALTVTASDATGGNYTVTFSNAFGTATSAPAILSVIDVTASFTNGGFEIVTGAPITPGTSVSLNPGDTWLAGWSVGGPGGDILVVNGSSEGLDPYEGEQWILFNSEGTAPGGTLTQTFSNTIGHADVVTFEVGAVGDGYVSVTASILDASGAALATNECAPVSGTWTQFSLLFTNFTKSTTLIFTDTSSAAPDADVALDDVLLYDSLSPPTIISSPVSATVNAGTSVSFTASAGGSPSTVQWFLGDTPLLAATNLTLTVTANEATAGSYTAVFKNAVGTATSTVGVLTVIGAPFANGGFEAVNGAPLAAGTEARLNPGDTRLAGWTVGGPGGDILLVNGAAESLNPYEGEQWILFNSDDSAPGGTLTQTFSNIIGNPHTIVFAVGAVGSGFVSITATALDANGTVLASRECVPVSGSWTQFGISFTNFTAETTLVFTDSSSAAPNADVALDDVYFADLLSAPTIINSPVSQTANPGTLVTFNAAGGGGPSSVQWFLDTYPIFDATNLALTVAATGITAGNYTVVFSNVLGAATSSVAVLTVTGAGFINGGFETVGGTPITLGTEEPINPGDTWLTGWSVGGPGGDILVVNGDADGLTPYEGKQWILFNGGGSPPGGTLSETFATPVGEPYSASFEVGEAGSGSLSVTAIVLNSDGAILASNLCLPVSGAWTQFQLSFTASTTNTTIMFRDSSANTLGGDVALDDVSVLRLAGAPEILSSPVSQIVDVGAAVNFTASADGSPLTVQWYFGTNAVTGATNPTLSLIASAATDGNYTAVFSNSQGTATSGAAILSAGSFINGGFELVNGLPLTPGAQLQLNPGDTTLAGWSVGGPGGDVTLVNGAADSLEPYEGAQWIIFDAGNSPPGGSLSQSFATSIGASYAVEFEVGQAGYGSMSLTAKAVASDGTVLDTLISVPASGSWTAFRMTFIASTTNTTLSFTDTSTQTGNIDIMMDDVVVTNLGVIPPTVSEPFTNGGFEFVNGPPLSPGGQAELNPGDTTLAGWTIGGPGGDVLLVNGSADSLEPEEGNQWILFNADDSAPGGTLSQTFATPVGEVYMLTFWLAQAGGGPTSVTVSATASDGTQLVDQQCFPGAGTWTQSQVFLTAATTNTTLVFTDTSGGTYDTDIGLDGASLTTSSGAPILISSPTNQTANAGTQVTLNALALGLSSVQWYWGNNAIVGATNATLNLGASDASAGSYRVTFSNAFGFITSSSAILTVVDPPVIVTSPLSQEAGIGASLTLAATVGGSPATVQWYLGSSALYGATNTSLMVTLFAATAGNYKAVFNNAAGTAASATATLTIANPTLSNGGFETINHSPMQPNTVLALTPGGSLLPFWAVGGTGGDIELVNGAFGSLTPFEGKQWVLFNFGTTPAGGSLSQFLITIPGEKYTVSFVVGQNGVDEGSLTATAFATDGSLLASNRCVPDPDAWLSFQLSFIATTPVTQIVFTDTSTNNAAANVALDDVTLTMARPILAAAPGTNSTLMLTLGGNPGVTYDLLSTTNVTEPNGWATVGSITLTDTVQTVTLGATNPMEFFKAVQR